MRNAKEPHPLCLCARDSGLSITAMAQRDRVSARGRYPRCGRDCCLGESGCLVVVESSLVENRTLGGRRLSRVGHWSLGIGDWVGHFDEGLYGQPETPLTDCEGPFVPRVPLAGDGTFSNETHEGGAGFLVGLLASLTAFAPRRTGTAQ